MSEPKEPVYNSDILDDELDQSIAPCSVCGIAIPHDNDPIVFCDGCQAATHKACYDISDKQMQQEHWFCEPCLKKVYCRQADGKPNEDLRCKLCGHLGGVKSRVAGGGWIHTSCAIYIPQNEFTSAGVNIEKTLARPFKGPCSLCNYPGGVTLRCGYGTCKNRVHVHCVIRHECLIDVFPHPLPDKQAFYLMFCKEHSPIVRKLSNAHRFIGAAAPGIVSIWSEGDIPETVHAVSCEDLMELKEHVREHARRRECPPYKQYNNPRALLDLCYYQRTTQPEPEVAEIPRPEAAKEAGRERETERERERERESFPAEQPSIKPMVTLSDVAPQVIADP